VLKNINVPPQLSCIEYVFTQIKQEYGLFVSMKMPFLNLQMKY